MPKIWMGRSITNKFLAPRCSKPVPAMMATKDERHASVKTRRAVRRPRSWRKNMSPIAATDRDSYAVVPMPWTIRPARRTL